MSIFDTTNLDVSFDKYIQSLITRGRSRLLEEFKNSAVVDQIVQVISTETQELYDAILGVLNGRTLGDAEGVQLDAIGLLIGQERISVEGALKTWFSTDDPDQGTDSVVLWMDGVSLYESTVVNDVQYKSLILAKIFKNHVQGASIPELRYFISILTAENVSFNTAAPLDANLVVRSDIKPSSLSLILTILPDGNKVQNKYLMPLAATTRIVGVEFIPVGSDNIGESFAPDTIYGTDNANLAVISPI